ncbi:MAG: tetratricopeptide repeat protein [Candidatus Omnitrophota bacterium]
MPSKRKRYFKRLILGVLASLIISSQARAFDKKESIALSRYIIAEMYAQLGETSSAIQEYKSALKADYQNAAIHLGLATTFFKDNQVDKAAEELNLAIKFDPDAVEPHAILALLYFSQNKVSLANAEYETALKKAIDIQPENADIYKNLGLLYLRQKKFKEAEGIYRLVLNISSQDAQVYFYLANISDELKNRAEAVKNLKKALELKPDYSPALNYLGYLYVEEGKNLDEAGDMIRRALEIEPDNGAYVDSLGWFYFKKGKTKEAIKELEKASGLMPDPVIYDHLGDAYFKINDLEKAKINWQKSLEMDNAQEKIKKKIEGIK